MPYNGYSEEYLDRLENGSIPTDNKSYSKRESPNLSIFWKRSRNTPRDVNIVLCPSTIKKKRKDK